MRRNFYEAFTLVEMLIVMGILIILMAIGITAGRFAINRANDVAHQNAVDQIYQGLQAYYTDERAFPVQQLPAALMTTLESYLDAGAFKGGTEATFIYTVGNNDQSVLVCVSLRGLASDNNTRPDGAYYCNGNGFGDTVLDLDITNKTSKNGDAETGTDFASIAAYYTNNSSTVASNWDGNAF